MPVLESPEELKARARKFTKGQSYQDFLALLERLAAKDYATVIAMGNTLFELDVAEVYQEFANQLGKDELTDTEKRQAIINHVLEETV